MAQRSSPGRGGAATATKSRSSWTSGVSESEIARLRVDEIRSQLRERGVSGISTLRKDDLVKTLVKTLRAEKRRETAAAKAGAQAPAKPAGAAAEPTEAKPAKEKRTTAATKRTAAKRAGPEKTTAAKGVGTAKKTAVTGGIRQGKTMSKSLKYSQRINSPDDRPERPGRSLVTTNHDVIRRWAEARNARPATIEGTEREGRPGVLTFNFPGWRDGRLREITWDEWFGTFDLRGLNFIYQEQLSDGRPSNFFRPESPDREDA
jgi:hypothetical protein